MPNIRLKWWRYAFAVLLAAISATCQENEREQSLPVKAADPARPGAVDVTAAIERVQLSFERRLDAFRARGKGYEVDIRERSASIRPRPHPALVREGVEAGQLRLGAPRYERGRLAIAQASGKGLVSANGSVEFRLEGVTERYTNTPRGLEQSWTFSERPSGSGDLTVSVPVSGVELVRRDENGLVFRDARSGLLLRYGAATWIDAGGGRTSSVPEYEGGAIRITIPGRVVDAARYPVLLDPQISPELRIGPTKRMLASPITPKVARGGNTQLVVWVDRYSGAVLATRIDATSGNILDPFGILISYEPWAVGESGYDPPVSVASNGTDFLVVWSSEDGLMGQRIRALDGARLDGPADDGGFTLLPPWVSPSAVLHYTGVHYYLTWLQSGDSGLAARGTRLSRDTGRRLDGMPNDPGTLLFEDAVVAPAIAVSPSNMLAVMNGRGRRIDKATGNLLDASDIRITNDLAVLVSGQYTEVAFDGTNYFVAWNLGGVLRGTRVTPSGSVLEPPDDFNGLPGGITLCAGFDVAGRQARPVLVSSGSAIIGLWDAYPNTGIKASRIDKATGTLLDGSSASACGKNLGFTGQPAATFVGDQLFVASGAHAYRFSSALAAVGTEPILYGGTANAQTNATVASNGRGWLVAWQEWSSAVEGVIESDVRAARLNEAGQVLDTSGIALGVVSERDSPPAVASNGTDYFVAWSGYVMNDLKCHLRGARIRASDGTVLDGAGGAGAVLDSAIGGTSCLAPALGSSGPNYLLAWFEYANSSTLNVKAARFDASGAVLENSLNETGVYLSSSSMGASDLRVVADAPADVTRRTYLVAWRDGVPGNERLLAARFRSHAGVPIGQTTQIPGTAALSPPALASDGTHFLMVWSDAPRGNGGSHDVRGVRIEPLDGTVLDATPLTIASDGNHQSIPGVAYDGRHYWIAWLEWPSDMLLADMAHTLRGTRMDRSGSLLDGPASARGFLIGDSSYARSLQLSSGPAGKIAAVSNEFDVAHGQNSVRVRAQILQNTPAELDAGIPLQDASDGSGGTSGGGGVDGSAGNAGVGGSGGQAGEGGAAGTISSGGTAGDAAAAGRGGDGGSAGGSGSAGQAGGASGRGGSAGSAAGAGEGGASGRAGSRGRGDDSASDGGCACSHIGTRDANGTLALLGLVLANALRRSRSRNRFVSGVSRHDTLAR